MNPVFRGRVLALALGASLAPVLAQAHGVAGARFFPATLAVDDPAVADELSAPTLSRMGGETDISAEFSKRLTSSLGVSFGETWTRLKEPGAPAAGGFQNLETSIKWQALTSAEHEAILAFGLQAEWSGTGAAGVGAERHSTFSPAIFFGKGAGDLPQSMGWARPLALTGQLGYAVPSRDHDPGEPEANPRIIEWGLTLQYSLPYLQSQVRDLGLPQPLAGMTPLVEARLESPTTGPDRTTTGTINPGVIWAGPHFQVGVEAMIPLNGESGRHVGAVMQFHMFLDDIFPHSFGKPIW